MSAVWLDCDPGHDDAIAILLSLFCKEIQLLGISTVHGNADAVCTAKNAARLCSAFGAPKTIQVYAGASKPLLRPVKHDPEIHGSDGLGGVEGLPNSTDPDALAYFASDSNGCHVRALDGMSAAVRAAWNSGQGSKVTVVSCGPMTNIALFVSVYPELLEAIEQFVFMGGAVGIGNRSAVAEYNILCDPEAAQIVLDSPVKAVMIPIDVTHTTIVTREVHAKLLGTSSSPDATLGNASTPLRHTLSTLIGFFAESYKSTFGFNDGPPLHDPLTIAYVAHPEWFTCSRRRVDVELRGTLSTGQTVVDIWNYRQCDDSWGPTGKNCLVAEAVDVDKFFHLFLDCVTACDQINPLNR